MPGGLDQTSRPLSDCRSFTQTETAGNGELYLNAGSCVHPGCITAIELEQMQMTLVKWKVATRPDMTMYVVREKLAGPAAIL